MYLQSSLRFCRQSRQNNSVHIFSDYATNTVRQRTTMVNACHTEYKKFSCLPIKILKLRTDGSLVILQLTYKKPTFKRDG